MKSRLLLLGAGLSWGCDAFSTADDLPVPEFLDTEAACEDGQMTYTALIRSELDVGNLVLERTDVDDDALEPVFPLVTAQTFGGEVTEWTTTLAHDCDTSIAVTWTATTLVETRATAQTAWPDVDLVEGPLDPPYGTHLGGSTVVIEGTDMALVDRVWFADAPATIVETTDTSVTVLTPAHDPGVVDVRYAVGVTELDLPEAFEFWPDQGGLVTGFSHMVTHLYNTTWFTIRSAYVAEEDFTFGPFVQHEVLFHEALDPSATFATEFYAPIGACEPGAISWTKHSVGAYLALHEDTLGELPMIPTESDQPTYYFVEQDIDPADWTDIVFDLEVTEDTDVMPAMLIDGALPIVEHPTSTSWDYTDLNGIDRYADLRFRWTPGLAEKVNYAIYPVYHDWRGIQVLSSLTCSDDGTTGDVTVAWDDIMAGLDDSVPTGLMVRLGLIHQHDSVLPHDDSVFQSTAINNYWIYYVFY